MTATTPLPTAAWSLDRLTSSLQRGGWGELDGPENAGLQKVLNALTSLLPWGSAEGSLTRAQVADAASMTPKWAGHCLRRLEELGLITWRRGWLDHGTPRAGSIRVHKWRLAEMVRAVRGYLDDRRAKRRDETRHRLTTTLRNSTQRPWTRQKALSCRGELNAPLPNKGRTAPQTPGFHHPPETLPGVEMRPDLSCRICGRGPDQCKKADSLLPSAMRHTYEPRNPDRGRLVAHHYKAEELIAAPFSLRQGTLPTEEQP